VLAPDILPPCVPFSADWKHILWQGFINSAIYLDSDVAYRLHSALVTAEQVQVEIYVAEDGKAPFEIWFGKLRDRQARARVLARIARIRLGNFGDSKALGEGLSELRIDYGPGYRLYFSQVEGRIVLLLFGGDKRTQSADIERARQYLADYKRRIKHKTGKEGISS
jgi:putative addiction module killer protein